MPLGQPQLQPVAGGGVLQTLNSIDELIDRLGIDENESRPATTTTIDTITTSNSVYHHSSTASGLQTTNQYNNSNIYVGIAAPRVCLSTGLRVRLSI